MHEFMRKKAADGERAAGREEDALGEAAVVRLMMLEAEVRNVIAEREKEMVVAIMARAEEDAGFGDDVDESFLNSGRNGEGGFTVGSEVELMVDGLAGRREINGAIVLTFDNRRVNEKIEGDGLEGDGAAGFVVDGQGRTKAPAFGAGEDGVVSDLRGGRARGIESDFVPLEDK